MNRLGTLVAFSRLQVISAWRSGMLPAFALLFGAVLAVLWFRLSGDGTVAGRVRLLVTYNLSLASLLLTLAGVWLGAESVSQEIAGRQVRLTSIKPVRLLDVLVGKWLGIAVVQAFFLAGAALVTWCEVRVCLRPALRAAAPGQKSGSGFLAARQTLSPRAEDVSAEVESVVAGLQRDGKVPKDLSRAELADVIGRRVLSSRSTVAPGGTRTWSFDRVPGEWGLASTWLKINCASARGAGWEVTGKWRVQVGGQSHDLGVLRLSASTTLVPIQAGWLSEAAEVRVVFENDVASVSASFDRDAGVELAVDEAPFGENLVRTTVVVLIGLMLVAALGVAAGTMLSFPVAMLVVIAMLLAGAQSRWIDRQTGGESRFVEAPVGGVASLVLRGVDRLAAGISVVHDFFLPGDPIAELSDGLSVTWLRVLRGVVVVLLVLGPVVLGVAAWALGRKELGVSL